MKIPSLPILLPLAALALTPSVSHAVIALGLTTTGLVQFDTANPGVILSSNTFTGLGADSIVDIDYRPSDGQLYGIAATGRLYTIDATTGSATINTSVGVGLLGSVLDADFNPTANRLRVYSTGDANFRLTPGTNDPAGVTIDGTLAYQAGDINAGQNPNLRASAYTNSVVGPASTTLYSIDAEFDTLVVHPAAGGPAFSSLSTVGELTILGLSINFQDNVGFDIFSSGGLNTGFVSNGSALYEVDLSTGDLVPLGTVGGTAGLTINSLAVVPEPGAMLLAGLPLGLLAFRRQRRLA